jgi:ubiquinone/menaquinone biosynthesis C-methylase UbiE
VANEFDARARTWDDDAKRQRARLVADGIRGRVPLNRSMSVFEYGCGTGLLSFELRPSVGSMLLADSSEGMLEVVREKIAATPGASMTAVALDLTRDAAPAGPFDLVCSQLVLHHVVPLEPVLDTFCRMLRPGGWLCVADLEAEDGSFHGEGFTGHHGFERAAFERSLSGCGLTAISWEICFDVTRDSGRKYPVFLSVSRKG